MLDLTVAICTYNGELRLPSVLEKLRSQVLTEAFSWEVLVVDNNSTDNTPAIVQTYQESWLPCISLRYCLEPKQGLAFARRRALQVARGSLIAFLDDDNWPCNTWVDSAYRFSQEHPQAGAYGSQIRGEYEIKPPENFTQIACFLGIIDRGPEPFRYDLLNRWLFPAGAGLVFRQQAWLESVPNHPILTGVSATSLSAKGEDIETLSYLRKKGWEIWHNPEMQIAHYIPKYRLQNTYLLKLFRGVGLSRYPLRMLKYPRWQHWGWCLVYFLGDLLKLVVRSLRYRSSLATDIVAQCQWELLLYSLVSPFYHWSQKRKEER
jgi:glycosyltransferase involved in cell wall biosynthesis